MNKNFVVIYGLGIESDLDVGSKYIHMIKFRYTHFSSSYRISLVLFEARVERKSLADVK